MSDISSPKIVIDLDDTISKTIDGKYKESVPIESVVNTLRKYKESGYEIIIYSSRNMRTYEGNIGKINMNTLPIVLDFLKKYDIPCDQVIMGKPWCGKGGFYIDDKAIRPSEFVKYSEQEIKDILKEETRFVRRES